ncbi:MULTISPECIES: hypothetical protein [unclassified Streptomyces]|uniref:hypothetical protein n=1 Tax=Streptomyces sp. SID8354 TaxID=2690339 RepID=UPI001EF0C02A|nr:MULTISPECIES: hypothetical protein [unclassified Streptomyces]
MLFFCKPNMCITRSDSSNCLACLVCQPATKLGEIGFGGSACQQAGIDVEAVESREDVLLREPVSCPAANDNVCSSVMASVSTSARAGNSNDTNPVRSPPSPQRNRVEGIEELGHGVLGGAHAPVAPGPVDTRLLECASGAVHARVAREGGRAARGAQ